LYGYGGGFTLEQVKGMRRDEREWFVRRVLKQREDEAAAIENARRK